MGIYYNYTYFSMTCFLLALFLRYLFVFVHKDLLILFNDYMLFNNIDGHMIFV